MAQYQSPEIRGLYNKYHKEAQAKGMDKKNQIEKYIQKYVKPTTECTDVPDNAYNDGAIPLAMGHTKVSPFTAE